MSTQTNPDQESANRSLPNSEGENVAIPPDWLAEFEAAARRPLEVRMRYSFIHTYKPVMDDASYRSFDTMEDYRRWCEENLPSWLGYGRV
ncbi:MAG TPA: hypothetical protein VN937_09430 [Blastocatellia bacterium]|nr:hypothetical protein [Blastocatellia bacterium]